MQKRFIQLTIIVIIIVFLGACAETPSTEDTAQVDIEQRISEFKTVKLTFFVNQLNERQQKMIPLLIKAAEEIDAIFWMQTYGNKNELLKNISDKNIRKFIHINYGPWARLEGNMPFLENAGNKPPGANLYPKDIKYLEFVNMKYEDKYSPYTLIRRSGDELTAIPYHDAYKKRLEKAHDYILQAAEICPADDFKNYLKLQADALISDNYYASDTAWLNMTENTIDFIIGPVESSEDNFLNIKTAYEAYLCVKDKSATAELQRIIRLLPELQRNLPVDSIYKSEIPGSQTGMGVYQVIYYAGLANAGVKMISISHPKNTQVLVEKGSRKLHFSNTMYAKFDHILYPIAKLLINKEQFHYIKPEAFVENSMFFEIAEGLGITHTINGKGTVKNALKEHYNTIQSAKNDVLRIYLISRLIDLGEYSDKDIMNNYVTYLADMFRTVRFGAANAQGKGSMICFNYFIEKEAFQYHPETNSYVVNYDLMQQAVSELAEIILKIQGDGDYEAAKQLVQEKGNISPELQKELERISKANIPRDIIFEQGIDVLGL